MPAVASDDSILRFSTSAFAESDRLPVLREFFGRKVTRAEFEPLSETVRADVMLRRFGQIGLVTIDHSLMNVSRTRELLADGDDSLILHVVAGPCRGRQWGRDVVLKTGDAGLISNADTCVFTCSGKTLLLSLARQELRPLIADFDSIIMRSVPADSSALRLLRHYVRLVEEAPELTAELQHLTVTHIYDLVAVTLGATRDAAEVARGRGIRAARLRAAKADVLSHLSDHMLSIHAVAARQGITPVYIGKLFGDEQLSFSTFVLENRLVRARHMLSNPRFRSRAIGAVALDCGFGDLSYFNRAFRRRFGASPSEIRADASRFWAQGAPDISDDR
jgi:AraC-like DNA-binding protein